MSVLSDKQSEELCSEIERNILKDGYFIFDTDDWNGLHITYEQFTHGKNYEYADYTEITVTLDIYNVTDKLQVKYNFIKSVYAERTGDSYRVYYKREDGENDGGRPYSLDDVAKFIANRFIKLVEDKIMSKKLEARIAKLERMLLKRRINENSSPAQDYSDLLNRIREAANQAQSLFNFPLQEEVEDYAAVTYDGDLQGEVSDAIYHLGKIITLCDNRLNN